MSAQKRFRRHKLTSRPRVVVPLLAVPAERLPLLPPRPAVPLVSLPSSPTLPVSPSAWLVSELVPFSCFKRGEVG